jgi:predicted DNA-binding protein (MmcQ/YjbR family)
MKRAALLTLCRRLPGATEDIKWGNDLVFSVGGKMFACLEAGGGDSVSFKTTPENFAMLTRNPGIVPAPYAARFHWVLVKESKALPDGALRELVVQAHTIVAECLPAKKRRLIFGEEPAAAVKKAKKAVPQRKKPAARRKKTRSHKA